MFSFNLRGNIKGCGEKGSRSYRIIVLPSSANKSLVLSFWSVRELKSRFTISINGKRSHIPLTNFTHKSFKTTI